MPQFGDNSDFLAEIQGETLDLPIRGKVFRFAGSPSLAIGAKLKEVERLTRGYVAGEIDESAIALDDPHTVYADMMGDQLPAMQEHGVTVAEFELVGQTLMTFYLYGLEVAKRTWSGEVQREGARILGEMRPTGTTPTATPKVKAAPSRGGTPTNRSSRSSKRTSTPSTAPASAR